MGNHQIATVETVRNLGAQMDKHLSMDSFIRAKSKSITFQLRTLRRIRKFLTDSACKMLVQATIQSRLDYCNSLLYGINEQYLNILQTLQNSAARLILSLSYYAPAIHPRRQLHWLPVRQRIIFKILTIVFKCVRSEAPVYLCELIQSYNPGRLLRSSSGNSLVVPRTRSKLADRDFSVCGPTLIYPNILD